MATAADNLFTRYNAICQELADIASGAVQYRSDAGATRKGSLDAQRLQLLAQLKLIREELAALGYEIEDGALVAGGDAPFEVHSQGL